MLNRTEKEKSILRNVIIDRGDLELKHEDEENILNDQIIEKIMALGYDEDAAFELSRFADTVRFNNETCEELFKTE